MTPKKKYKRPKKKPPKKTTTRKKTSKKATKKKTPAKKASTKQRRGRSLARTEPAKYYLKESDIRRQAAIEFITDEQARSIVFWYERADRPYRDLVSLSAFRQWAATDEWRQRRDAYWRELEDRILKERQKGQVIERLNEIERLSEDRDAMMEFLRPMRDENGNVLRYPETYANGLPHPMAGMPRYPLEMPRLDQMIRALIELDKHLMLKRGEAVSRTEETNSESDNRQSPLREAGGLSREDLRAMAIETLRRNQPELADAEPIDIGENREDDDGTAG